MKIGTVLGSINLDHMIRAHRAPQGGETLHAEEVFSSGGGKGANQAVATKRLGVDTTMLGAVGSDDEGRVMLELLTEEGICLEGIKTLADTRTGQAFIIVEDSGENRILVHGGANMKLTPEMMNEYKDMLQKTDFVLSQFEVPMSVITAAFRLAKKAGVMTVLNPAPAPEEIPHDLLEVTDIVIPNETEAQLLTGIEVNDETSMRQCAEALHEKGISTVIITLGSRGAYYHTKDKEGIVPAFKVEAKDTTAAGDTFIGAFMSKLNDDMSNLEEAIRFGNLASSIAVQRFGAQLSIPTLEELTKE